MKICCKMLNDQGQLDIDLKKIYRKMLESEALSELSAFHGTSKQFDKPNPNMIYWVTTDKSFAQEYADGSAVHRSGTPIVYEHDINVHTPAKVANDYCSISKLLVDWYSSRPNQSANKDAILTKKNEIIDYWHHIGLDNSHTAVYNHWNISGEPGNKLLKEYLHLLGYDSIYYTEAGADTYGILDVTQIRSVI
jgi:hypothetical protein